MLSMEESSVSGSVQAVTLSVQFMLKILLSSSSSSSSIG